MSMSIKTTSMDKNSDEETRAWIAAAAVLDPEVPCVTVEDLGILRRIIVIDGVATAYVTPTYSGCPAVDVIESSIKQALEQSGFVANIERSMSPAWTTDWITDTGRAKLKAYGIAPPACAANGSNTGKPDSTITFFTRHQITCPRCDSNNTRLLSDFGSTACKAQHQCNSCLEPFDHFKPL